MSEILTVQYLGGQDILTNGVNSLTAVNEGFRFNLESGNVDSGFNIENGEVSLYNIDVAHDFDKVEFENGSTITGAGLPPGGLILESSDTSGIKVKTSEINNLLQIYNITGENIVNLTSDADSYNFNNKDFKNIKSITNSSSNMEIKAPFVALESSTNFLDIKSNLGNSFFVNGNQKFNIYNNNILCRVPLKLNNNNIEDVDAILSGSSGILNFDNKFKTNTTGIDMINNKITNAEEITSGINSIINIDNKFKTTTTENITLQDLNFNNKNIKNIDAINFISGENIISDDADNKITYTASEHTFTSLTGIEQIIDENQIITFAPTKNWNVSTENITNNITTNGTYTETLTSTEDNVTHNASSYLNHAFTSTGNTQITIAADTDNVTETDNPHLYLSQDGNLVGGGVCIGANQPTLKR